LLEVFQSWTPGLKDGSIPNLLAIALDPKQWISWQGGALAFVLMFSCALLYRLHPLRHLIRLLKRFGLARGAKDRTEKIVVAFYDRFHALCQTHNLSRSVGQTHQEFAEVVTRQFHPQLSAADLTEVPRKVTEFFYDIRFGHRDLSRQQIDGIDTQLTSLEQCIGTTPESNRHR
jgi:hypothetical protein